MLRISARGKALSIHGLEEGGFSRGDDLAAEEEKKSPVRLVKPG